MRRGGYAFTEDSDPARVRARQNGQRPGFLTRLARRRQPGLSSVADREIAGRAGPIPVRIYRPTPAAEQPLVVYFHGGGWVVGNLDSHDAICRRLAREAGAVVVAVDYRLAPEHKFPSAVEDCYDAVCWAADHAAELGSRRRAALRRRGQRRRQPGRRGQPAGPRRQAARPSPPRS